VETLMGAFLDFQKAAFAALNGNPALVTVIGSGKVFDDVPVAGESGAPSMPWVVIGEQSGEEDGASDVDAAAMSISVHAWSRGAGRAQCLAMLDAIRDALHNKSLFVTTGVIVFLNYAGHETELQEDRETYHGEIRFSGIYQYG
jgi:hypothetical protein